ncbi:uncharacterized protein [Montipora foliosa]|uniref:uncharacterized protein n=1 Tax=Montipora foliosa TaxID=591990 RepID=UPI0035F1B810
MSEISRERVSIDRTPLVTTFNPHAAFIAIANRNWQFLQSKERLAHIFQEPLSIAYRRPKSLRDTLVRNDVIAGGFGPCNKPRCSWCSRINKTSTFTGTQNCKLYQIFHTMDCQSAWVIYVIECKICKLQYVGKSETVFKLPLNNHRNHIKSKVSSCELTEHFLHNTRTHNFDNDVEQIKRSDMLIERKKELLHKREMFWQRKLNTLQPKGAQQKNRLEWIRKYTFIKYCVHSCLET